MSHIDWSKAPEGAEYARKTTAGVDWYKRDALGIWVYMANNGEWTAAMWTSEKDCEQRPAWTGEGLPPVGAVCEFIGNTGGSKDWKECRVIAHDEQYAVINYKNNYSGHLPGSFRPIRTPEQIAAEEREKQLPLIYGDLVASGLHRSQQAFDAVAAMYDAGYRKFGITDEPKS